MSSARLSRFARVPAPLLQALWSGLFVGLVIGSWPQTVLAQLSCTVTQVTPFTNVIGFISINAAGTLIAFTSDADLTGGNPDRSQEIFLLDMTTNAFRQITDTIGGGPGGTISADGTRIAFVDIADITGGNPDGNQEVSLFDIATQTFTQITSSTQGQAFGPSLNANGTRIAIQTDADLTGGNPDGGREIFLFDTTTSTFTQITSSTGSNENPAINGDGTRIAFQSNADLTGGNPDGNYEIFLFNTPTNTLTQITNTSGPFNIQASINADGTRIAFTSTADFTGENPDGSEEIFLFDTSASTFLQITSNLGTVTEFPAINADGTHIAFTSNGGSGGVFLFDTTTNTLTQVGDRQTTGLPAINADGTRIAFERGAAIFLASCAAANQPPIANAGPDQTVRPGTTVILDGSGSFDPDGHTPLQFAWTFAQKPAGSAATLTGADTSTPSFTADVTGNYRLRLVVTDTQGATSEPDEVLVSTVNSQPVAEAGPDQAVSVRGTTIQLDGGQSYDPDGDPITFAWTLLQKPAMSTATLSHATSSTSTFIADVQGDYVMRLVVTDSFGAASDADTVLVSFDNVPPVADAGDTQTVLVGATVVLDGSGSFDANGDPLTFHWSLTITPDSSQATLSNPLAEAPTFTADQPGSYTASLIVNDELVDSTPAFVNIVAITIQTHLTQPASEAIDIINGFDPAVFQNEKQQNTLTQSIGVVIDQIQHEAYQGALQKLENDVLARLDGCAASNPPQPDKNDWILDCATQAQIYPSIIEAIERLESQL
ncbi:MAG: PKD domain-containing protein [Candidatus Entotheonellia bacterium]